MILTDMKNTVDTEGIILVQVRKSRLEIEGRRKKLSVSDDILVQKIMDKIAADHLVFNTEKERTRYYNSITHDILWYCANKEESDEIISRLKSGDQKFTKKFFYGTNHNDCNISRFRSKILSMIKQTYKVDVSVEEFGNILYIYLWNKGTWSVLDKYSCKSSFFCWLEDVSKHEVIKNLEEMNIINVSREPTNGNKRLLGRSIKPEVWEYIISDIMPDGLYKDVLMLTLVERKSEKDILSALHLVDAEQWHCIQKRAENDLKDRIIRSGSSYAELVLRDKSAKIVEVSDEYISEFAKWQEDKGDISPLADMLGVNLSKGELQQKVVDFLYQFPEKLKWSDEDRLIWTLRFIEGVAPVEVAGRLGRNRSWLDNRYSKLNKRFNKAIQDWWRNYAK